MKLIIAYIKPERLNAVKQELYKRNVFKMSVSNALGCGQQKGYVEAYRGAMAEVNLLKKVRLASTTTSSKPRSKASSPGRGPAGSATGKSSFCRWRTASASAPANTARMPSDDRYASQKRFHYFRR